MGRVIEVVRGRGEVYDGEKRLGEASYSIMVYQETRTVETLTERHEIDGLQRITGTIIVRPPLSDFGLLENDNLTLRLEDGRRWDFALKDNQGTAVNTGEGLYKA